MPDAFAMIRECGQACDRENKVTLHDTSPAESYGWDYRPDTPAPSDTGVDHRPLPARDSEVLEQEW